MELAFSIGTMGIGSTEQTNAMPFELLTNIYREQGLQFDEYSNPVYLSYDDPEVKI